MNQLASQKKPVIAAKHSIFTRELLAASGEPNDPQTAAKAWRLQHFGHFRGPALRRPNCALCHSLIAHFAIIANTKNGVQLKIGHDCLIKLRDLAMTGEVNSVNPLRTFEQFRKDIHDYIKRELGNDRKIISSVTSWLESQEDLPESIKESLLMLRESGVTPSQDAAEELVDYYKTHRLLPVGEVLTPSERIFALSKIPHVRAIPRMITLARLPKLKRILAYHERKQKERAAQVSQAKEVVRREALDLHIKKLIKKGRVIRGKFHKGKLRETSERQWLFRRKGTCYLLSPLDTYSREEGEVLLVLRDDFAKKQPGKVTVLARMYDTHHFGGKPELTYKNESGQKRWVL